MKTGQRNGLWYAEVEECSLTVSGYVKREHAILLARSLHKSLGLPSYEATAHYHLAFEVLKIMRERGMPV